MRLLLLALLLTGCGKHKPDTRSNLPTLHNYPIFHAKDCPVKWPDYDEAEVKRRAKQLGLRPVDYLHQMSNKRYKKINK